MEPLTITNSYLYLKDKPASARTNFCFCSSKSRFLLKGNMKSEAR